MAENELKRLQVLRDYAIVDTLPEQSYNDIVLLASCICEVPIALVSFVDRDRQWFKAACRLQATETQRNVSFCTHTIAAASDVFIVPDATADPRFADNELVTGEPHIRFYAGAPLVTPDGHALGTICVIDREPRQLNDLQIDSLRTLSRQIMVLLEMARQRRHLEQVLEENRRIQTELLGQNTILQNAYEGISHIGTDGRYVMANIRYAATCGYTPEEMTGMPWQQTVHPDEINRMDLLCQEMFQTGYAEAETTGVRKDGSIFYKHVTMVPFFDSSGQPAGHYCFMRDITSRKITERRLRRRAYHDELTGLPNRAALLENLSDLVARAKRLHDYTFAVLFIDLDLFKPINDRYGHAAGDAVLKEIAGRIESCLRHGDIVGRIGGDEFVVVLDDIEGLEDASDVSDRIHQAMQAPFFWQNSTFPVGVSIGYAIGNADVESATAILHEADQAMYKVKKGRRLRPTPHATPVYDVLRSISAESR